MAQWYYTQNGQQAGPVDDAQIKGLVANGQIGPSDLIWKDGMTSWQPASSVPEITGAGTIAGYPSQPQSTAAHANVAQAQSYGGPQAYASPVGYGGYPAQQGYAPGSVPNYLVQSILVTCFCFWPLGIPAIVFAAQVNSKLLRGDYAGALESSKKAKMFSWLAFGASAVIMAICLIIFVLVAIFANNQ